MSKDQIPAISGQIDSVLLRILAPMKRRVEALDKSVFALEKTKVTLKELLAGLNQPPVVAPGVIAELPTIVGWHFKILDSLVTVTIEPPFVPPGELASPFYQQIASIQLFRADGPAEVEAANLIDQTTGNQLLDASPKKAQSYRYWLRAVGFDGRFGPYSPLEGFDIVFPTQTGEALSVFLTNDSHIVPTDGAGNNGDFSGANGEFHVLDGNVDVSADAAFSEVLETGLTGDINSTLNEFFTGPIGAYRVTAATLNSSTYKMRAIYNGVTFDRIFSIAKSAAPLSGVAVLTTNPSSTNNGLINGIGGGEGTVTPNGGTAPYTVQWNRRAGNSQQITEETPTTLTTTFASTGTDVEFTDTFEVVVTDNISGQITTNFITVTHVHGSPP